MPPTGMEDQIAFAPSTVPRGWVLLFYCLAATSSVLQAPQYATLKPKLRWNTWMALDDGSLFLEASEVNIQALFALAIHGDSFATPSMSWTLVSHACRMAQALNLHHPGQEQRKLLLFWSLYAVDKGASLAFGRPPTLAFPYYQTVSSPDIYGLADYAPHLNRHEENLMHSQVGGFGATHFIQAVELSILTGKILHFLNCLDSFDSVKYRRERNTFHDELREWYSATMTVG
jgi:hypothetical protein